MKDVAVYRVTKSSGWRILTKTSTPCRRCRRRPTGDLERNADTFTSAPLQIPFPPSSFSSFPDLALPHRSVRSDDRKATTARKAIMRDRPDWRGPRTTVYSARTAGTATNRDDEP